MHQILFFNSSVWPQVLFLSCKGKLQLLLYDCRHLLVVSLPYNRNKTKITPPRSTSATNPKLNLQGMGLIIY